jgi:hypothetical protein
MYVGQACHLHCFHSFTRLHPSNTGALEVQKHRGHGLALERLLQLVS